jgi:DNA repair protein RadA/Sms
VAKAKTSFFCTNCGAESSKWVGQCPSCKEWNTLVEELVVKTKNSASAAITSSTRNVAKKLSEIESENYSRFNTSINELNRILGGGIVPGSLILLGGEPGIGKSTLALQCVLQANHINSLYVSGEESLEQLKLRATRININNNNALFLNEISLEAILGKIEHHTPQLVIIDSIQTMFSEQLDSVPGSVSQIRECAGRLLRIAKEKNVAVVVIGHITKDGTIAGPKILEHIVDTVLQFEGESKNNYRILRSHKNRFGSTDELGIFEMVKTGLREIANPSEILVQHKDTALSGVAIASSIDGIRPFLLEVQALVSTAAYGTPQRSSTGFDNRRLNMLLAVLEKRAGFRLAAKDVFINLAGGIKLYDTGLDLAVVSAILSSNIDTPIVAKTCFTGEIGLTGEIRPVNRIDQRIAEAEKLGFSRIIIPDRNTVEPSKERVIEIIKTSKIDGAFSKIFA